MPKLTETATSVGFEFIKYDLVTISDEYRAFWNQSNLLALEDFGGKLEGNAANEVNDLMEQLGDEFASGTSVAAEFFCFVSRKPL